MWRSKFHLYSDWYSQFGHRSIDEGYAQIMMATLIPREKHMSKTRWGARRSAKCAMRDEGGGEGGP